MTTPASAPARIREYDLTVVDDLTGSLLDEAWTLYHRRFAPLNRLTIQRHLMFRSEFDQFAADKKIQKYLVFHRDQLVGLSAYTNHLDHVPLVSEPYFEHHWPHHHANKRIWYCLFAAATPGARGTPNPAFGMLVEAMYKTATETDSLICIDVASYNEEVHRLARRVTTMLRRFGGDVRPQCMGDQTYWLYEFPAS